MITKKTVKAISETIRNISNLQNIQEYLNIPEEDGKNRQGYNAYILKDELRLISILNTCDLSDQCYRTSSELLEELRDLIDRIAIKDPYFVCQAIVYSRCIGAGKRDINNFASAIIAPYIIGEEYAKRFYGAFDRKTYMGGGCIYRLDDMSSIKNVYMELTGKCLPNSMRKGFAGVLENADAYTLTKYKRVIVDIINLVHPNPKKSTATVMLEDKSVKVLDAIMQGKTISANTWESLNCKAGREIAQAVQSGKMDDETAKAELKKKKNDNWRALLENGQLGILAALRNIRNILLGNDREIIEMLCNLLCDGDKILKGKVMPFQIDTAYEVIKNELHYIDGANKVLAALEDGYVKSIPNLADIFKGKTCVIVDCSGSMHIQCACDANSNFRSKNIKASAASKAGLIAATIAKACPGTDIIRFGTQADYMSYDSAMNVFELGKRISSMDMGMTNIGRAFDLMHAFGIHYDQVILLSDYECNRFSEQQSIHNRHWTSQAYANYVRDVCSPNVYCVDFCAYGTVPVKNNGKIQYYFGYGFDMFNDIAANNFDPEMHIDKVRKIKI